MQYNVYVLGGRLKKGEEIAARGLYADVWMYVWVWVYMSARPLNAAGESIFNDDTF